jgi:hypothetical protein
MYIYTHTIYLVQNLSPFLKVAPLRKAALGTSGRGPVPSAYCAVGIRIVSEILIAQQESLYRAPDPDS